MVNYTIIEIGNLDKKAADKLYEKINGKSYMNFEVIRAPCPGGFGVSVQSTYDAPRDQIIGMLFYCMANEL